MLVISKMLKIVLFRCDTFLCKVKSFFTHSQDESKGGIFFFTRVAKTQVLQ